MYDRQKVLDIALAEVGYLEKASNSQLDSKTANAGKQNYTKYARDLAKFPFYNGSKTGAAWCDVFVDWCFVQAYGLDAARSLTCQPTKASVNYGAGCRFSRDYYKSKGQLHDTPQPGDQIFFYSSDKSSIAHTGLVYKVDSTKVYTVEGNTSGASGVIANGGGVCKKSYSLTYSRIAGYGRPDYGQNGQETPAGAPAEKADQKPAPEAGAAQTGQNGAKTGVYDMGTMRKGDRGMRVRVLQWLLNYYGYTCGTIDGIMGAKTEKAVKEYQRANGLEADGIAGPKTWAKLMAG